MINCHEIKSLQGLRNRIVQEFGDLRNKANFVRATVWKMRRRATDCVDQKLGHVEENLRLFFLIFISG